MDSESLTLKILYIIPEFDEGGAEVHVLNLIHELSGRNHDITLVSSGGRLESQLPERVKIINLPVHRKNIFTGLYCAFKLYSLNKIYHWDLIHVHSRVPAWIGWLLSGLSGIRFIVTAHSLYSLNAGLIPFRHSAGVICVSESVKKHLTKYLPARNIRVIYNGIIKSGLEHTYSGGVTRFLFTGRLTRLKGLDVALRALGELKGYDWTLDVLGDGPQRSGLEALSQGLGLSGRVTFHGSQDKSQVAKFMSESSCLLFPSVSEGMGLVVLEAVSCGLRVIASDIEALHELSGCGLVKAGDVEAWRCTIENFLETGESSVFDTGKIISVQEMADLTERFYYEIKEATPRES
ncbi:MAG: glycosyltransferase family 4 protein [Synergistaceae bacterium]|nr:glycosyltransferase family 4 protein [Synergistaceae bacterium]